MSEFRVPTRQLPVELWWEDGRTLAGHVFMPEQSSRFGARMHPDEWVNADQRFFPFKSQGARHHIIVSKASIVAMTVHADHACPDDEIPANVPIYRVAVEARGHRFEGHIVVDMPRDQQRVLDWLNAADPFVTIRDGAYHHFVQKHHITRVVETPED